MDMNPNKPSCTAEFRGSYRFLSGIKGSGPGTRSQEPFFVICVSCSCFSYHEKYSECKSPYISPGSQTFWDAFFLEEEE